MKRIVLIAGFESFNADLYRQAAHLASERCPDLKIDIFSDRALNSEPDTVEAAMQQADVFFASLLFDQELVSLRDLIAEYREDPPEKFSVIGSNL